MGYKGTFSTLHTVEVTDEKNIIRIWVHFPSKLRIKSSDVTVMINGEEVSNPLIRRTSEPEIYDLLLLNVLLKDSDRVVVEFNVETIKEADAPSRTLLEILEEEDYLYLYRYGNKLFAYLIVDWPILGDLADVEVASRRDNNVLTWSEDEKNWEPVLHEHVLNSLKDVISPSPNQGDILQLDQNGKNLWKPTPHLLNTLIDVEATSPTNEEVLTWNANQKHWEPREAHAAGEFVDAPAGSFAIIAAGYFSYNSNKDQVIEVSPPYNQLQAERISVGHYRLHFPYLSAPSKYPPSYIVKATCIKPTRKKTSDEIKNIFPKSIPDQGIIQVSEKPHTTFEVWISQPVIDGKKLKKILGGKESYTNVFEYKLVDFPFMIEVSLYGSRIPGLIKGRVDINKASIEELIDLPVLGEELAKRIDQRRKEIGPFKTIDELDAIRGISKAGVNILRGHFKIEGKSP